MRHPVLSAFLPVLLSLALLPLRAGDAPPPEIPGDPTIADYLKAETRKQSEFLPGVTSPGDFEKRRAELEREYFDMLGLWPLPPRTPLQAKTTGVIERDGFRVEKVHFQSRPGLYVTTNLYLPAKVEGKLPTVLYLCGHSGRGRDGNKTAFQHHGMWFATHGYVCLIVDTLQLGEVAGIHHGTYRYNRWWWQARGYSPAAVECWNGIRALDYLESRPEVDASRIAATGISGGGAATFWIAAADKRVKVAVPVSGMGDLETYVTDRVIDGHCDCMLLVNSYRWEWTSIAALVAPRPMLFANSDHDSIFPMSGNERIAARLRRLYSLLGKPEAFDTFVTGGDHDDKLPLRLAAYRWINRWLKGDAGEVTEPELPKIPGAELRVFPDALPADAIDDTIDESFVALASPKLPEKPSEYGPWREDLLGKIRKMSLGPPEKEMLVAEFKPPKPRDDIHTIWLVLLGPGETETDWANGFVGDRQKMVFAPRGIGKNAWSQRPPYYVDRALALLGRTADAGRVWDVAIAARKLRAGSLHENPIGVAGKGAMGVIAAYAGLVEPAIEKVAISAPTVTHRDGPTLLDVLRYCDVPEVIGMLAPKLLTLQGADAGLVKEVQAIYKAAGAAESLTVRK